MSALMVMGTGSDVGKSLIVAGLCRAFKNRGMSVRPFKPQNMSNNAAVTMEGGEIGRAQALQAKACGVEPSVHMNPVLLKPETDIGSQVIVQGKRVATMSARDYFKNRAQFMPQILKSYEHLQKEADLVLVEGAGSPAEVNLREADLANMGFAQAADLPVLLVGDIHRGGVIASLVGTKHVLNNADAVRIKAFLINNFHGDTSLFDEGLRIIEQQTGWRSAGVVPHFASARNLPAEDALALDTMTQEDGIIKIAVPRLSRIANFDDLDPLRLESNVAVTFVQPGEILPADADLILIPGSKSTIADMEFFQTQGWDIDLKAHIRRGGRVLGICGGYQMLGRMIHDPNGIEGPAGSIKGLGLLDVEATLVEKKSLEISTAYHHATDKKLVGYEMHLGETTGPDCARPFARISARYEGASVRDGQISGTYLHGIFASDDFRHAYLAALGSKNCGMSYAHVIEETLDGLANHLEKNVALDHLLDIARGQPS
ncbi:MAG: cobyric acid synthase [Hyphomicrobiales bacterium]